MPCRGAAGVAGRNWPREGDVARLISRCPEPLLVPLAVLRLLAGAGHPRSGGGRIARSRSDEAGGDQGHRRHGRQVPKRPRWMEPSACPAGAIRRQGCPGSGWSLDPGEREPSGPAGQSRWLLRHRTAGPSGASHGKSLGEQSGNSKQVKKSFHGRMIMARVNVLLHPGQSRLLCHATALAWGTIFWDTLELYQIAVTERR